jgi:fermentation-respiration switch protein FrsA (DUF1100 family)
MAFNICPMPLPRWFFTHKFDSHSKIGVITCPILLGHGRRDTLVPFAMFERLAATAKGSLSTLVLDEAAHNDFYDLGGSRIEQAIVKFASSLKRASDGSLTSTTHRSEVRDAGR